ncbi:hypothetical protein B0T22DRAFT_523022 [Podospora appendiculata]|uniref:Oxidoreductase acuF-like C2H2 type zinc-finger domain-containing protein n=1 Tax=Podospora appendiculata TaxID=314037 RepID=A0AAE0X0C2_9PEZI|nr:hypothetical protein B0T22DRAFT_523022 [Podospora appendiculata]
MTDPAEEGNIATKRNNNGVLITLSSSSITDAYERFILWAGNLGALRSPTARISLDYRLSEAPDLRTYIFRELDDMLEASQDLSNIITGFSPNRAMATDSDLDSSLEQDSPPATEQHNSQSPDEAHSILEVIKQCITSLFRVGMLVRNTAPLDRFKRALRTSNIAFPDNFDIDYVQHKQPKLGTGVLSKRLGSSVAKRRQFIKYCRDHKARLAADDLDDADDDGSTTARLSSKATTFVAQPDLGAALKAELEAEVVDDNVSYLTASTTAESMSHATLRLPRLAEICKENGPFECPICCTLQAFQQETSWELHAYRDLKAYVCTMGGQECNAELFGDRHSWFNHELTKHRARYTCTLCNQGPLNAAELRAHLLDHHEKFNEQQLRALEDGARDTITSFDAKDCPFCDDWDATLRQKMNPSRNAAEQQDKKEKSSVMVSASRFKRHVALHQEQLALFALPRIADENGSPGSGSAIGSTATEDLISDPGSFGEGEASDRPFLVDTHLGKKQPDLTKQ